jgi:hypothetical protein
VYWRARDSESGNRKSDNGKSDAMNTIDTKQKILDAVDANFDAQLATTNEYVDLDSLWKSTKASALFIAEWCGVEKV